VGAERRLPPLVYQYGPTPPDGLPGPAQSGLWAVWMGGYSEADDTLSQTVTIPAGTTALTLSGYYIVGSNDSADTVYDTLDVTLGSGFIHEYSNVDQIPRGLGAVLLQPADARRRDPRPRLPRDQRLRSDRRHHDLVLRRQRLAQGADLPVASVLAVVARVIDVEPRDGADGPVAHAGECVAPRRHPTR